MIRRLPFTSKIRLTPAFRLAVVLLAVLALQVAGVTAVTTTSMAPVKTAELAPLASDQNNILPGPPPPEEGSSKMAPDGQRGGMPVGQLTAPAIPGVDNDRRELSLETITPVPLVVNTYILADESPVFGSTSQVFAQLGARFTLVGARPSGTM